MITTQIFIFKKILPPPQGFPCPFLTRYCCQRETLIDMSGAIDRTLKSTDHQNRNSPHLVASDTRISTGKRNTNSKQVVSPTIDVSKPLVPNVGIVSNVSSVMNVPNASGVSSVLEVTQVSVVSNTSEVSEASETSTVIPTHSTAEKKGSRNSGRRARPKACSCTTRDQCLAWWSDLDDPPEVKVRTSLSCDVPGQVTCCFGRIVPPRHHKSRDPTRSGHSVRHPMKATRWRPLANTWKHFISWFNG